MGSGTPGKAIVSRGEIRDFGENIYNTVFITLLPQGRLLPIIRFVLAPGARAARDPPAQIGGRSVPTGFDNRV